MIHGEKMNWKWTPVTKEEQLKQGMKIKIVAFNKERDSYKFITIKKVLYMKNRKREWIEILINKKKNYYFNLTAYLNKEDTWGKWVKELYFQEPLTKEIK